MHKHNLLRFLKGPTSNDASAQDDRSPLRPEKAPAVEKHQFGVDHSYEGQPARRFSPERTDSSRERSQVLLHWLPEILAAVLGLAMLFALIAILDTRRGNPLPKWPYQISVNAVVSVLIIIQKASMAFVLAEGLGELKWGWFRKWHPLRDIETFDEASRGPWGSLKLIHTLRARNVLSSVGAAVFIVALAIEPFSQQLLSYYTCPQVIPSGASLPRTQYYRGLDHTHLFAGMSGTDYGLQSNAYAGIFSNSPIQVEFECTSGNCTFDEFASVGICSHCDEIHGIEIATETAQGRNGDEGPILTSAFARNYSIFTGESLVQTNNVNTSPPYFPFEFLVGDSSLGPGFGSNVSVQFLAANPWWTSITNEDGDESLPPPSDCSAPSRNTSWPCKGQGAANCTIGICVKTYRSEVTNGKLVENVTSTFANFSLTPDYGMVDTGCIPPALRANLTNQGNITDEPRFQQLDPIPWNELDIPDACFYKVEMGTASGTARFVGDFLTGNVSFDYANDFTAPPMYPSVTAGPVQLQRLWMNGNMTIDSLNEMLGVMTESMTTYLRQTGEANVSAPVLGTSVVYDTCIAVQWGWLALPAALQAVTVAFLCALMLRIRLTHSGSSSAWKTSALALIFHSLDREILDRDGGRLHRMDEMKEKAGRLKVRMEPSGRGWKLVEEIRIVR